MSRWWRDRQNECRQIWPQQTFITESWDAKQAHLNEELELERLALQGRIKRIHKAYSCLKKLKELGEIKVSDMRPKLLFQARKDLNEAIKLIRQKTNCKTFLTDVETLKKKVTEFIDQPGIDINFTYLA